MQKSECIKNVLLTDSDHNVEGGKKYGFAITANSYMVVNYHCIWLWQMNAIAVLTQDVKGRILRIVMCRVFLWSISKWTHTQTTLMDERRDDL